MPSAGIYATEPGAAVLGETAAAAAGVAGGGGHLVEEGVGPGKDADGAGADGVGAAGGPMPLVGVGFRAEAVELGADRGDDDEPTGIGGSMLTAAPNS